MLAFQSLLLKTVLQRVRATPWEGKMRDRGNHDRVRIRPIVAIVAQLLANLLTQAPAHATPPSRFEVAAERPACVVRILESLASLESELYFTLRSSQELLSNPLKYCFLAGSFSKLFVQFQQNRQNCPIADQRLSSGGRLEAFNGLIKQIKNGVDGSYLFCSQIEGAADLPELLEATENSVVSCRGTQDTLKSLFPIVP